MTSQNSELDCETKERRKSRALRFLGVLFIFAVVFELLYIAILWPDWHSIQEGEIPKSAFIMRYERELQQGLHTKPLRWQPIKKRLSKKQLQPFILAEDSRFYQHDGFDFQAFFEAMNYNWRHGRVILGASTISQQTIKNLLLSPSKNLLRKWHELIFTVIMEAQLEKQQILHTYVNIAEFGPGIYGIEAAARAYFGKSAHKLGRSEMILLAASLPSPKKHNPRTHTGQFQARVDRIQGYFRRSYQENQLPTHFQTNESVTESSWDIPIERVEVSSPIKEKEPLSDPLDISQYSSMDEIEAPAPAEKRINRNNPLTSIENPVFSAPDDEPVSTMSEEEPQADAETLGSLPGESDD